MQDEFRGMVISLAGALIFFGAAFWVLDLGGIWSFFLGALVYGGLLLLTKPRRRLGGIDVEQIPGGEQLEEKLRELHKKAGSILKYLEEHPGKIMEARRFIDYYQDTASSLLEKYVKLQETGLGSREAERLKVQTTQALLTLNRAFEGQFEKLMGNELMDMEAEIRLLKQTMEMEGYEEENH